MKLDQSTLQRTFMVKHKGKSYCVNYLNSDGQILGLLNRSNWEITVDGEELNIYSFKSDTKKEKEQVDKNMGLAEKLVEFCVKHFNDYQPELPDEMP